MKRRTTRCAIFVLSAGLIGLQLSLYSQSQLSPWFHPGKEPELEWAQNSGGAPASPAAAVVGTAVVRQNISAKQCAKDVGDFPRNKILIIHEQHLQADHEWQPVASLLSPLPHLECHTAGDGL
jgi:hypothetical protein